ncbi:MAG: hypothetical protein ACREJB_00325 [Planctomycetaceae bacterium]
MTQQNIQSTQPSGVGQTDDAACGCGPEMVGSQTQGQSGKERVKQHARQDMDKARRKGAEIADETRHVTREVMEDAKRTTREAARRIQDEGRTFATRQKDQCAETFAHLSTAISRAAEKLHEEEDHQVATYAEMGADQLHHVADYLHRRDVRGLYTDIENFARRRPEIFFGGLFVVGLGVARFLKASSRPRIDEDFDFEEPRRFSGQTRQFPEDRQYGGESYEGLTASSDAESSDVESSEFQTAGSISTGRASGSQTGPPSPSGTRTSSPERTI